MFSFVRFNMAATSILSTDAEMNAMAGENVDVNGWTDANKTAWGLQAESFLNNLTQYNFSDNYSSLNDDVKKILNEYVARYTAVSGIGYNMNGFETDPSLSRIHAEDMINIHTYRMEKIENLLKEEKVKDFLKGA